MQTGRDEEPTPADLFREMAARIERNAPEEFAGAIMLVPPPSNDGRNGAPVEILLIDPNQDPRHFWATAKSESEIAAGAFLAEQQIPMPGYGR